MEQTLGNITVNCNYEFVQISSVSITIEPNEHGVAVIEGILAENEGGRQFRTNRERIKIKETETGETEIVLFSGIIGKTELRHRRGVLYLSLTAYTDTIQLDIKRRSRSFQAFEGTYQTIFQTIIRKEHKGDFIGIDEMERKQDIFILQYNETDWELCKRVASRLGVVLIPDVLGEKPRISIGVPERKQSSIFLMDAQIQVIKKLLRHEDTIQNGNEKHEQDHIIYRLECSENLSIGTDVKYGSNLLTVCKIQVKTIAGKIIKEYDLCRREGIYKNPYSNKSIVGLSLAGRVLEVWKDRIKLHLNIDEVQTKESACWFPVSTVYAANGHTGLYLMPEVDTQMVLYFPSAEENSAFIRAEARIDVDSSGKTKDTSLKFLETGSGKELLLGQEQMMLTAVKGQFSLNLMEDGGINLNSTEEIKLQSKESIQLNGRKFHVTAGTQITLQAGNSSISLDNLTHLKGTVIKMSEMMKR